MGNLFSTSRGAGTWENPVSDLLPAFMEAIPLLSSILKPSEDGSPPLLSLLQRLATAVPGLEGVEKAKE
ncbi:MAG TPA: hypothetical protein GX393_08895 [Firmicutes bacterium]|nr:hypothetical protein [Bacillota bacterium]